MFLCVIRLHKTNTIEPVKNDIIFFVLNYFLPSKQTQIFENYKS